MSTKSIVILTKNIPDVSTETEGKLKGGFIPLGGNETNALQNLNCPTLGGGCSASGNSNIANVNCPQKGGTCSGSANFDKFEVKNLNCGVNGGSCEGTISTGDTSDTSSGEILGQSMLY